MLGHRHVAQCGLMISRHARAGGWRACSAGPWSATTSTAPTRPPSHAGLLRLAELMFAAGARRVILPVGRVPELDGPGDPRLRELRLGRAT